MKINKAFKFRIYPTKKQIEYIENCFDDCRYVYNVSLSCEEQLYTLGAKSNLSAFGLNYHLKAYKISTPRIKRSDAHALAYEMENLASAYKKFFSGGGFPKYKKRYDSYQSFRTRQAIEVLKDGIKIPKLDSIIYAKFHRYIEGIAKQMTISRENKKYYVSIMCEIEKIIIPVTDIKNDVGIDLGVKDLMVLSDGSKIENPKTLNKYAEHLKKLQQKLAKQKKGSNNHIKTKAKIANLHELIANKRELFLHETTSNIVKNFDKFYIEDLNVKGMSSSAKGTLENPGKNVKQKSGLNKSILDSGFSKGITMLTYKAKWSGKSVVKVGKFFPSSKNCSSCGYKHKELKLSDRTWECPNCGSKLDRDINASINIRNEGRLIECKK